MIYTITFNPSLDYFVHLSKSYEEGEIMRSDKSYINVGGKGINISLTLARLGVKSVVLTFIGGSIGSFIKKKIDSVPNIELRKVDIEEENRINVKIKTTKETAINALGPIVNEIHQTELLELLADLQLNDYVVISGSYCKGVTTDLVVEISEITKAKGAKLITDVPNLKYEDLKRIKPFLIKPNVEELNDIFKKELSPSEYETYVEKLLNVGVENVLLSIGAPGSYFANKDVRYRLKGPNIDVVSTVGCGDSMLAYTLSRLSIGDDFKTAITYGEAAGRVKAGKTGPADPYEVKAMTVQIRVEEVDSR